MKFVSMVWEAAGRHRIPLGIALAASTFGLVGVLATISQVLDPQAGQRPQLVPLLIFACVAFAVIIGDALGQRVASVIVEDFLDKTRRRFADLVRRADYGRFEAVGSHAIYDGLTRNSATLTEAALLAVHCVSAIGALILGGLYTLLLSPLVFAVMVILIALSFLFFRLTQDRVREALTEANTRELSFLGLFRHLLDGFKEVKLNARRGNELEHGHLVPESFRVRDAQINAAVHISRRISVSYILFYTMLATIAFVLPPFVSEQRVIVQSVYVAVFMLSIVEAIVKSLPTLTRANFAIDDLEAAALELERSVRDEKDGAARASFDRIEANGIVYSYREADGARTFAMGPASFTISRGETVFIVGGNGSGKSTLLKTLTRLYEPEAGSLVWDGKPVDDSNVAAYRSLFSAVFSDFHLFDRLYGMGDVPEAEVNALLAEFGIAGKTQYRDGRFTNTSLSTGQRKRLALAVALLESRPILVLDELAADQDPEFRRAFYSVLVPRWRAEGRTLIIVSHDDRYFDIADRTMVLQDGRPKDVGRGGVGGPEGD